MGCVQDMARSDRVQSVARLVYRDNAHRKSCMVKRVKVRSTDIGIEAVKFTPTKRPKAEQAWRYPGGIIQRADSLYPNNSTKRYYDPKEKDKDHPRRKQESNFFITINTNRKVDGMIIDKGQDAMKRLLAYLAKDEVVCSYMKFGPKDPDTYGDDNYNDVIDKVEFKSCVEVGENLERLHAHIWMTVTHYSQVQINIPMVQYHTLNIYNTAVALDPRLMITGQPYVNVKLLPQSNWTDVMKNYLRKGMESVANA